MARVAFPAAIEESRPCLNGRKSETSVPLAIRWRSLDQLLVSSFLPIHFPFVMPGEYAPAKEEPRGYQSHRGHASGNSLKTKVRKALSCKFPDSALLPPT